MVKMMAVRWLHLTPIHLHLLPLIMVGHVLNEVLGYSLASILKTALWQRRDCSLWKNCECESSVLHKAMQMQTFHLGIFHQYVYEYIVHFMIIVSLIFLPFSVPWEKCIVLAPVFHRKSEKLYFDPYISWKLTKVSTPLLCLLWCLLSPQAVLSIVDNSEPLLVVKNSCEKQYNHHFDLKM